MLFFQNKEKWLKFHKDMVLKQENIMVQFMPLEEIQVILNISWQSEIGVQRFGMKTQKPQ